MRIIRFAGSAVSLASISGSLGCSQLTYWKIMCEVLEIDLDDCICPAKHEEGFHQILALQDRNPTQHIIFCTFYINTHFQKLCMKMGTASLERCERKGFKKSMQSPYPRVSRQRWMLCAPKQYILVVAIANGSGSTGSVFIHLAPVCAWQWW